MIAFLSFSYKHETVLLLPGPPRGSPPPGLQLRWAALGCNKRNRYVGRKRRTERERQRERERERETEREPKRERERESEPVRTSDSEVQLLLPRCQKLTASHSQSARWSSLGLRSSWSQRLFCTIAASKPGQWSPEREAAAMEGRLAEYCSGWPRTWPSFSDVPQLDSWVSHAVDQCAEVCEGVPWGICCGCSRQLEGTQTVLHFPV